MDRSTAIEALRQVYDGMDFVAPRRALSRMTPEQAAVHLPSAPYSILTNVAHAEFWQRIWLNRLKGLRRPSITEDWRVPDKSEWPEIRSAWLDGMVEAIRIAEAEPFEHKMKSDGDAVTAMLEMALHNSYHLGQVVLLKRMARKTRAG